MVVSSVLPKPLEVHKLEYIWPKRTPIPLVSSGSIIGIGSIIEHELTKVLAGTYREKSYGEMGVLGKRWSQIW